MRDALQLIALLVRSSRGMPRASGRIVAGLALSVVAGTLFPLLVAAIGAAISQGLDRALLLRILALCAAAPCARLGSQALFDAIATRVIFDLRLTLCRKLLAAPLARLEQIGPSRLSAALDDDMASITNGLGLLPILAMQVGVMAGLLTYMASLSPRWLLLVAGVFALGIGVLRLPAIRADRYKARERRDTDAMSAHVADLIVGAKELQLDRERRQEWIGRAVVPAAKALNRSTFLGSAASTFADAWGDILFLALPAVVLFGAGRGGAALPVLAGYTLALLYIRTPTRVLLQAAPALGRAHAAALAVERLEDELAGADEPGADEPGTDEPGADEPGADEPGEDEREGLRESWKRLELRAVTHTYGARGDSDRFTLGPVSLTLAPGDIVFLVGGNGSGKTTLAKVLTGLYPPDAGQILLDDAPVGNHNRDDYRQMFSTVFADFYPFETLNGPRAADSDRAAAEYVKRLRLTDKVTVEGGRLGTADLSPAERRRLALVAAEVEDRPVYLFDEWAADQDPSQKQIFYLELLPEMKARGKAVVVITNDDAFYPVADRLIKLARGRIE